MNTDDNKYQKAKKRVKALRDFYTHLVVYVLINSMLFIINITTSPDMLWFYWPLFGWGIGLVMHAVHVFSFGRWLGPDWEEKKIQAIINED